MPRQAGNAKDKEIAGRLKARRLLLGMSLETLGSKVGVTFQQIQNYENGKNRISASRLLQLAEALEVPVSYFFGERKNEHEAQSELAKLATVTDTVRLLRAVNRLSRSARTELIKLAESWKDRK